MVKINELNPEYVDMLRQYYVNSLSISEISEINEGTYEITKKDIDIIKAKIFNNQRRNVKVEVPYNTMFQKKLQKLSDIGKSIRNNSLNITSERTNNLLYQYGKIRFYKNDKDIIGLYINDLKYLFSDNEIHSNIRNIFSSNKLQKIINNIKNQKLKLKLNKETQKYFDINIKKMKKMITIIKFLEEINITKIEKNLFKDKAILNAILNNILNNILKNTTFKNFKINDLNDLKKILKTLMDINMVYYEDQIIKIHILIYIFDKDKAGDNIAGDNIAEDNIAEDNKAKDNIAGDNKAEDNKAKDNKAKDNKITFSINDLISIMNGLLKKAFDIELKTKVSLLEKIKSTGTMNRHSFKILSTNIESFPSKYNRHMDIFSKDDLLSIHEQIIIEIYSYIKKNENSNISRFLDILLRAWKDIYFNQMDLDLKIIYYNLLKVLPKDIIMYLKLYKLIDLLLSSNKNENKKIFNKEDIEVNYLISIMNDLLIEGFDEELKDKVKLLENIKRTGTKNTHSFKILSENIESFSSKYK